MKSMVKFHVRGVEAGADDPSLAGDGDAMYAAFRAWKGTNG